MNQQLQKKLVGLENKIYDKIMHSVSEQEKIVYNMLSDLIKELQQLLMHINDMSNDSFYRSLLLSGHTQYEDIIEETLEILEELIEMPFKILIGKKLYVAIEDQMADLDDWIETINEEIEDASKVFPYIEAWDIGVFLEDIN